MLGRRTFLRTLGAGLGGGLLSPMLSDLSAEAALGSAAKRFVMIIISNGFPTTPDNPHNEFYRPGALIEPPANAARFTPWGAAPLPELLTPFDAIRSDLTVIDGLYNPRNIDLHGNVFGATCVMDRPAGAMDAQPGGISIDRYMAKAIGLGTPFDSINLSVMYHDSQPAHRSSDGPGVQFPAESNPISAFDKLFGQAVAASANKAAAAEKLAREQSILNVVRADVSRVRGRLGKYEAGKLDQYLESIDGLERQLVALASGSANCRAPTPPPVSEGSYYQAVNPEVVDAQVEITANALICGLTRVAALSFGTDDGGISHYGFTALEHKGSHHEYCHAGNHAAQLEIQKYIFSKVTALWQKLQAVPEGNGTMADSTLLLIINDGGGVHHDGTDYMPLFMLGSGGGYLKSGQFIELPAPSSGYRRWKGDRCTSDVFVTVANALGVDTNTFGDPSICKGAVAELLA
jgi:hypothetical protein